jgi:predicted membrane metal-binding protein
MNKLLGYSLMGIGLLGFFFFLKYKGAVIPVKELWFVLSIFVLIAGAYFLAKHKLQQLSSQRNYSNINRLSEIERLKRTGDKIRVTLDNAEVKSRSYKQEIINQGLPSRMEMLDALYDSNRNYKTQEVQQTYILFYKQYSGKTYKFVSQATTQSADALKRYIDEQKGIELYIDPKNPTIFYFDLPYV